MTNVFTILEYNQTEEKLCGKFANYPKEYTYERVSEFMYRKLCNLLNHGNNKAACALLNQFDLIEPEKEGLFVKEIEEMVSEYSGEERKRHAVGDFFHGVTALAKKIMVLMEDPEAEAEDLSKLFDEVQQSMETALLQYGACDKVGS